MQEEEYDSKGIRLGLSLIAREEGSAVQSWEKLVEHLLFLCKGKATRISAQRSQRIRAGLPVCFACRFHVGVRRAQTNSRVVFRTIRLTCPLLITACPYFLTFLLALISCTGTPTRVILCRLLQLQASKKSKTKRARKAKPAPHQ